MYKIGLSTNGKNISEELFENSQKAGISAMEISADTSKYDTLDYKLIESLAKKYNVDLWSFHFPFMPNSKIDISNKDLKKANIEYFFEMIKKATNIGIDKFVIHASGETFEDYERDERMKCAKESLAELAEFADKYNAVIAVEDLPRTCLGNNSDEIKELISAHDSLKVCLDTNHLLNEDVVDFINALKGKIITTHISDYDFINERHWLPGEGKLNWRRILDALRNIDYKGVWLYEIRFTCPNTIIRDRDLNCFDFVKNANEIFENRKITVFSSPKPNLGMWE